MMDSKPFSEFNILDITDNSVQELKKLSKVNFNIDEILSAASELKYMKETKRILSDMLTNPSDEFVKFFASRIYSGVKTQKVISTFTEIVKRSFNQFINEKINERLKSAITSDDVAEIRELYKDFRLEEVRTRYSVSFKSENKSIQELLIFNF